jgi:hypothetical protein
MVMLMSCCCSLETLSVAAVKRVGASRIKHEMVRIRLFIIHTPRIPVVFEVDEFYTKLSSSKTEIWILVFL